MNIRAAYILSIVALVIFIFFTLHSIYVVAVEPSPPVRNILVEFDKESIIHTIIENNEGRDIEYTIQIVEDGRVVTSQPVLIRDGKSFSYMRHVYPAVNGKKKVSVLIYRDDKTEPVDNTTYYAGMGAKTE